MESMTEFVKLLPGHARGSRVSMVVEMVPLKGGIGSIVHPPGSAIYIYIYRWYILPIGGLYATDPTF